MTKRLTLILLTTLRCNADCEYCFENKSAHDLTHQQVMIIFDKLLGYMTENDIRELTIYWLGGEIMLLEPEWYLRANDFIRTLAEQKGITVRHYMQSNLLAYNSKWNRVISEMFRNCIGTSLDFPNLYRRTFGGNAEAYDKIWTRRFREVRENGISVGVISIPNRQTLEIGAADFYSYYVDDVGIKSLKVNTPFPGGAPNPLKLTFPLNSELLTLFYTQLADVWMTQGYECGVRLDPLQGLIEYFLNGDKSQLECIWRPACGDEHISIDPRGNVSACDCMAASYPEFSFGNVFDCRDMSEVMNSPVRQQIRDRPSQLIRIEECIDCDYLAICHGGCFTRAYSTFGRISAKDPDCHVHKAVFRHMSNAAVKLAGTNVIRRSIGATPS